MEDEGTKAEVTEESVFRILAGRKDLNCPCEADLINSASPTTAGEKDIRRPLVNPASDMEEDEEIPYETYWEGGNIVAKTSSYCYLDQDRRVFWDGSPLYEAAVASGEKGLKRPLVNSASDMEEDQGQVKGKRLCVKKPTCSSASATGTKAEVRRPSAYPSEYAYIEYPFANAYSTEIPYEEFVEGGRIVKKIARSCYQNPRPKVTSERPRVRGGARLRPPNTKFLFEGSALYKAAVASGAKIITNGHSWTTNINTRMFNR